jgi:hypothetical protein
VCLCGVGEQILGAQHEEEASFYRERWLASGVGEEKEEPLKSQPRKGCPGCQQLADDLQVAHASYQSKVGHVQVRPRR